MRAASATACAWLPDEYATTPARALLGREPGQGVERAAELERADALQVLALEQHLGPELGVDARRAQHRRAVGVARDPGGRGPDVLDGRGHFPALVQIVTGVPGARLPCGLSPTTWPCGSDDGIGRSRVG